MLPMASTNDGTDATRFVVNSFSLARRIWYRRIRLILTDSRHSTGSASIHETKREEEKKTKNEQKIINHEKCVRYKWSDGLNDVCTVGMKIAADYHILHLLI